VALIFFHVELPAIAKHFPGAPIASGKSNYSRKGAKLAKESQNRKKILPDHWQVYGDFVGWHHTLTECAALANLGVRA
jgi:hypothetical protein